MAPRDARMGRNSKEGSIETDITAPQGAQKTVSAHCGILHVRYEFPVWQIVLDWKGEEWVSN